MAFIFRCDDLPTSAVGGKPQTGKDLCNASETLSLSDPSQFQFATPVSTKVALPGQRQFGTTGREVVGEVTTDSAGNQYIVGQTDGSFTGAAQTDNRIFVKRVNVDGTFDSNLVPVSALQFGTPHEDRSIIGLRSGVLFVGGMTEGALGGASSGSFDAFVVKVDSATMKVQP